jgi:hypothetical protein
VAEDGVLKFELTHTSASAEESDHASEHEVDDGSQGARMLPTAVNHAGTEIWSSTSSAGTAGAVTVCQTLLPCHTPGNT